MKIAHMRYENLEVIVIQDMWHSQTFMVVSMYSVFVCLVLQKYVIDSTPDTLIWRALSWPIQYTCKRHEPQSTSSLSTLRAWLRTFSVLRLTQVTLNSRRNLILKVIIIYDNYLSSLESCSKESSNDINDIFHHSWNNPSLSRSLVYSSNLWSLHAMTIYSLYVFMKFSIIEQKIRNLSHWLHSSLRTSHALYS